MAYKRDKIAYRWSVEHRLIKCNFGENEIITSNQPGNHADSIETIIFWIILIFNPQMSGLKSQF